MAYLVKLGVDQLGHLDFDLSANLRFTKTLPPDLPGEGHNPRIALLLSTTAGTSSDAEQRAIVWMGVVSRINTPGPVDKSITIDPLRKCPEIVPIDGAEGVLNHLPEPYRARFDKALGSGRGVGSCDQETWNALVKAISERFSTTGRLLKWLMAHADPYRFNRQSAADLSWQEQADALGTAARILDIPLPTFTAWRPPASPDAPYLAGLIPEPVEHSLIEHDARQSVLDERALFQQWRENPSMRCDIYVMYDNKGRRLEVANVNATPVEKRLGTDLVYYHEPTHSFMLVQYKRVDPIKQSFTVDQRLRDQLDRLEQVAELSAGPTSPDDWRLGADSCFLKLAWWPEHRQAIDALADGMYLPLSYVRLLLQDDCTRGRGESRILGRTTVPRYLVNSQFNELVKHGLVGTIGTSVEQLRDFSAKRAKEGRSVVVAAEQGPETSRQRQTRANRRGAKNKTRVNRSYQQQSLFDPEP